MPSALSHRHFSVAVVEITEKYFDQTVEDTHTVVVRKRSFCVLHSEVFILAPAPQGLHFIIIVRICIRVSAQGKNRGNTHHDVFTVDVYSLQTFLKTFFCVLYEQTLQRSTRRTILKYIYISFNDRDVAAS